MRCFITLLLVHDDIMRRLHFRRENQTVIKSGIENSNLSGMNVCKSCGCFLKLQPAQQLQTYFEYLIKTAAEGLWCGKQMDMEFWKQTSFIDGLSSNDGIKNCSLIGSELKIGAEWLSNASAEDAKSYIRIWHGIWNRFPARLITLMLMLTKDFGKRVGGDIIANKKTYWYWKHWNFANEIQFKELNLV